MSYYELSGSSLTLYLSTEYHNLDTTVALLLRAAVVKTLTQIPAVNDVTFYVGDIPMTDSSGNLIGALSADSFVENPGGQINYTAETTLSLYFADETGTKLVKEVQNVYYITSIAMEKLVVERLIAGPETEGYKATVPSGTKIISVTTLDGTCYVNLNDGFLVQDYEVAEDVVIYSIVDSLFALNNGISAVQITVNGESNIVYREAISLNQNFTRNTDLIAEDDAQDVVEVELVSE